MTATLGRATLTRSFNQVQVSGVKDTVSLNSVVRSVIDTFGSGKLGGQGLTIQGESVEGLVAILIDHDLNKEARTLVNEHLGGATTSATTAGATLAGGVAVVLEGAAATRGGGPIGRHRIVPHATVVTISDNVRVRSFAPISVSVEDLNHTIVVDEVGLPVGATTERSALARSVLRLGFHRGVEDIRVLDITNDVGVGVDVEVIRLLRHPANRATTGTTLWLAGGEPLTKRVEFLIREATKSGGILIPLAPIGVLVGVSHIEVGAIAWEKTVLLEPGGHLIEVI
jgi:hypothetical protein